MFQLYVLPPSQAAPSQPLAGHNTNGSVDSRQDIGNPQLLTIVQEAVNSTINLLGENSTITTGNTLQIVNHIVEGILSSGLCSPKCIPRTAEDLMEHFIEMNNNHGNNFKRSSTEDQHSSCLLLEKMTVGPVGEDIYYIKTNSSCRKSDVIDAVCYASDVRQEDQCSVGTQLQPIAPDFNKRINYFPHYKFQLMCGGCSSTDNECLRQHNSCYVAESKVNFAPLKRVEGQCDEDGYEKWVEGEEQEVNVDCNCRQTAVPKS